MRGQPKRGGRRKGTPNKVTAGFKASLRAAFDELAREQFPALKAALLRGCVSKPPASLGYLTLALYYLDGKPAETVRTTGTQPIHLILNHPSEDRPPSVSAPGPWGRPRA